MLSLLDDLRELTMLSVLLRMLLAVLLGGIIGIEREYKHRPAGIRTHILICLGAAMTTLTSQYLYLELHYLTDLSRLGAQVIAGIGFLGAGTIIVTRRNRIRGLTTAAGLWASAVVGLALGAGFYEGGVLAATLILLAELVFSRFENRLGKGSPEVELHTYYTDGTDSSCLEAMLDLFDQCGAVVLNLELERVQSQGDSLEHAVIFLRLRRRSDLGDLMEELQQLDGTQSVEHS